MIPGESRSISQIRDVNSVVANGCLWSCSRVYRHLWHPTQHRYRRCQATFFSGNSTASASASSDTGEGRQVCDVYLVILGLMAGVPPDGQRFYSQSQRADHKKYYSIYSQIDIPLNDRNNDNDAWNARPSTDSWHAGAAMGANEAQHRRQHSAAAYDEKYDSEPSYGVKRQDSDRSFAEPHRPIGNEQPYQYRQ
ncbi:long-chain-acyl-CoA dehydrogenase [Rhizoctonia solani]|uniref:Long-chain-acyl-CoA dehydrogenase n=1 Tax=Rhizoctonia solani TaxID=456999 RepID=A0A8H7M257_9AGAM|nr:long-chain-acyl-CoA dehydrogenase [Rhizoctonia solani]